MASEPWRSDKWFSSPWNYLPEVTRDFAIPESVQIHDVTLRDDEQQAGVEFTAHDKLRIAEALAGAGIHPIEAGLPAVSPADKEGNAPTEETVLALLTMYGIDSGIKTERFTEIARLVADLSGIGQPANRTVTGDMLYNVESGIITTWVNNVGDDLLEPFPYQPELVGQADRDIVLGKG